MNKRWIVALVLLVDPALSCADSSADMAETQRKLNAETMQQPFEVEDAAKIDSYVNEAMKKNLQPRKAPPSYWRPGYTCASIYEDSWTDYRDCMYYHRYYGQAQFQMVAYVLNLEKSSPTAAEQALG